MLTPILIVLYRAAQKAKMMGEAQAKKLEEEAKKKGGTQPISIKK